MGAITEGASGAADSDFMTFSGWYRWAGSAGATVSCRLFSANDAAGNGGFEVGLRSGALNGNQISITINPPVGSTTTPGTSTHWLCPVTGVGEAFNTELAVAPWNHLMFALDMGHTGRQPLGTAGPPYPSDEKLCIIYSNGVQVNVMDTRSTSYAPMLGMPYDEVTFDIGMETGTQYYPLSISGLQVGIPDTPYYLANPPFGTPNPAFKAANFHIWVGQFIDPRTAANLAKLVRITPPTIRPVNPTVSAAAFGRPTYSFIGNKDSFPINRGLGGAFTKTGTINNFTPGP